MSNIYKGEFQDYEGNVVYPHTSADVVFATDGQTIQKKLNDAEIDYTDVKAQLTSGEHEFRFGVTADGEFGYHKEVEGADTVIPFKSAKVNTKLHISDRLSGALTVTFEIDKLPIDGSPFCLLLHEAKDAHTYYLGFVSYVEDEIKFIGTLKRIRSYNDSADNKDWHTVNETLITMKKTDTHMIVPSDCPYRGVYGGPTVYLQYAEEC